LKLIDKNFLFVGKNLRNAVLYVKEVLAIRYRTPHRISKFFLKFSGIGFSIKQKFITLPAALAGKNISLGNV